MDDLSYLRNNRDLLQLDPMQRKTYQLFLLVGSMYNMRWEFSYFSYIFDSA